jgi:outer membrane protein assembly factor BamB
MLRVLTVIIVAPVLTLIQSDLGSGASYQARQDKKAEASQSTKRAGAKVAIAEAGATSTSRLALPFKRAWQYLTDSASTKPASLDGSRIYLPLEGGRVICLERETGALLWTSEPGGIITSPVAVGNDSIYIATRKTADDGSEAGGSLRSIDKTTGLTIWVKDYPRPFASPLQLAANRIYGGNADGSFYSLSSENGELIWKIETQDVVHGCALITSRWIYFGSDDGAVRAVEPDHGQLNWKYQTGGKIVGRPATDERAVYFGSGDGYVYSVDSLTGKLRWRSRTGAAVEASPAVVGDRVLVASFDNFVYAISRATGDRIWKRRLENRLTSSPVVLGDASLVAPLRGDYVAVFLNADGRRVNLYQLDKDFEIVADPIFAADTLVLATNKGLVVATPTKPTDTQTRAVKR